MKLTRSALLALSASLIAMPALADGFSVYEVSARGVGMAGAMMFSDEASLIAYNPAGITHLDEKGTFSGSLTFIAPRGKTDFLMADGSKLNAHNKGNPAYVPAMFYARKVKDRNLWWGIGAFSRFGLKATYDHGWYGRFSGRNAELYTGSVTPTVAFKIGSKLSMSVNAEVMYARLKFDKSTKDFAPLGKEMEMRNPVAYKGMGALMSEVTTEVEGDSWGYGWGVGLNYDFDEHFSAAFLYRSEVKQTFEGDATFRPALKQDMTIGTDVEGSVHLPESFTFGLGYRFNQNRTRVEFDAIRTNWSSYEDLTMKFKTPAAFQTVLGPSFTSTTPKYWENGWRYQFGIEHRLNQRWTLRAGFVYDDCSSDNPKYADYMVPTGVRRTYSVGASYRNRNVEYSLGFGYMSVGSKDIWASGANGEDSRLGSTYSTIVSAGVRVDL